jgi:nucleotide-binding universal stress UspA family protein
MKTIIVATDFSAAAKNAAYYASEMALFLNASIHLLHVYEIPVVYLEVPLAMTEDEMTESSRKALDELKLELIAKTNNTIAIESEIIVGRFYAELESACERIKPYVVVIGSQGTTAAERLFFGGHAVFAIKNLQWPLITIPVGTKFSSIKKIGLACDLDNIADAVPVDEIETLVDDFNAELHILNIGKQKVYSPDVAFEAVVLKGRLAYAKPSYHFLENDDTDEGIIQFSEKNNIDLLIVMPKRHSLMAKLIHRSHAGQLVLHSHVPVMALHAK